MADPPWAGHAIVPVGRVLTNHFTQSLRSRILPDTHFPTVGSVSPDRHLPFFFLALGFVVDEPLPFFSLLL